MKKRRIVLVVSLVFLVSVYGVGYYLLANVPVLAKEYIEERVSDHVGRPVESSMMYWNEHFRSMIFTGVKVSKTSGFKSSSAMYIDRIQIDFDLVDMLLGTEWVEYIGIHGVRVSSGNLEAPISIGTMSWHKLFQGVFVQDVKVSNPPGFDGPHAAYAERLWVDYNPMHKLRNTMQIKRVEVNSLDINVDWRMRFKSHACPIIDKLDLCLVDETILRTFESNLCAVTNNATMGSGRQVIIDRLDIIDITVNGEKSPNGMHRRNIEL